MKSPRVVIRYSSMHEKTLPNRSLRCRMDLHRASLARTQWPWTAFRIHNLREIPVKTTAVGGEERGYDGGKKVKGSLSAISW